MYQNLFVIFTILCIAGCSTHTKIIESHSSGAPKVTKHFRKWWFSSKSRPYLLTQHHFTGKPIMQVALKDSTYHGAVKAWWSSRKAKAINPLKYKGHYCQGQRCKKWVWYYEDGRSKAQIGKYVNNQKHGPWETFFKSGRIKKRSIYAQGKAIGEEYNFYLNGNIAVKNTCFDTHDTGAIIHYFENGKLKSHRQCLKGIVTGPYIELSKKGNTLVTGQSDKNGKKTGIWKKFYPSGVLKQQCHYLKGLRQDSCVGYDPNGKVVEYGVFSQGSGIYTILFPSGATKSTQSYLRGNQHGDHWTWYETGTPQSHAIYINDTIQVKYQWYANHRDSIPLLASSGRFKEGKRHGKWVWFSKTGRRVETAMYQNGLRQGPSHYYNDSTGQLIRTQHFHKGMATVANITKETKGK